MNTKKEEKKRTRTRKNNEKKKEDEQEQLKNIYLRREHPATSRHEIAPS